MRNNKTLLIVIICITAITFIGCSSSDDSEDRGNWQERSVFDGTPRSNAVGFTIDDFGYMGTGYDGDDYLNDFWQYNIEGNYWVQKADFPGVARSSASGFTIDGKGYVGVGYDGDDELSDFWEYNPTTNAWTQKADFGGGVRRAAVEFGINGAGYIGTGNDGNNDKKDFWKYNPQTDVWSELVGFGGEKRVDATTFIVNDKVYLGTGVSNGLYKVDFWEFDPISEVWTRKNDLDEDDDYNITRSNAVSFSVDGLGYIATGYYGGAIGTIWEYNALLDEWEEISALEATVRQDAVAFSNGSRAFVSMGRTGSLYLDDIYEVYPQDDYDDED
ncbi:Kelch repeat-containing protein [Mariniflexile sp. AS56]|uniref:Kelch repeat-containing protein n=1 Tax=Mariniflexile sp. AS56 TaxID=3063957 RepID=UPI0026F0CC5F|nr:kelch repeat-containing protein [Mariniflexile sp. AS56]MDO7172871.1 galactose oxidase [Mariniflexile sp. AS56]